MKYYSTKGNANAVDFRTAVSQGLPPDNGLYFPEEIPQLSTAFINNLANVHIHEVAHTIAWPFVKENLSKSELATIVERTLNFSIPLVELSEGLSVLELFHGPTLAFKDVGARFLAGCLQKFAQQNNKELTILVATSGDTGSAVANAFLGLDGINVCVLYPSGKVSELQEKQMTTLGQNITALEVNGTFDDCQKLVKQAFLDTHLQQEKNLTSANSINIARLLPQSFYYFHAFQQLENWEAVTFSVPSGNLGNVCAGLFAQAMGLPAQQFIAGHNANNTFTNFLDTGDYLPKPSVKTLSNAMDVGNPSNFVRIYELFNGNLNKMKEKITSVSYNDLQTKKALRRGFSEYNYVFDPHTAIGFRAVQELKIKNAVILETAHPAKFRDTVQAALDTNIPIPPPLQTAMDKEKLSIPFENNFQQFKEFLLNQ